VDEAAVIVTVFPIAKLTNGVDVAWAVLAGVVMVTEVWLVVALGDTLKSLFVSVVIPVFPDTDAAVFG
jgi:hypothetical protein